MSEAALAELRAEVRELKRRLDQADKGDYSASPFAVELIKRLERVEQRAENSRLTMGQKVAIFAPIAATMSLAILNYLTKAPA